MNTEKFKYLHKPMILAAALIWVGYVFMAKGVMEGVMTIVLLLLMIIAMNVRF